jgi:hypothetical protein
MLIGYARASKAGGSQGLDLQRDALAVAGVAPGELLRPANACRRRALRIADHLPGSLKRPFMDVRQFGSAN